MRGVSYSEARGDCERAGEETGLDSADSDAGEHEVLVEAGFITGADGRNRVESRQGFWFLLAQLRLLDLLRLLLLHLCAFHCVKLTNRYGAMAICQFRWWVHLGLMDLRSYISPFFFLIWPFLNFCLKKPVLINILEEILL